MWVSSQWRPGGALSIRTPGCSVQSHLSRRWSSPKSWRDSVRRPALPIPGLHRAAARRRAAVWPASAVLPGSARCRASLGRAAAPPGPHGAGGRRRRRVLGGRWRFPRPARTALDHGRLLRHRLDGLRRRLGGLHNGSPGRPARLGRRLQAGFPQRALSCVFTQACWPRWPTFSGAVSLDGVLPGPFTTGSKRCGFFVDRVDLRAGAQTARAAGWRETSGLSLAGATTAAGRPQTSHASAQSLENSL